ncbi:MAG TPA: molybdenum cofactor guanylyltransferase [Candidatus Acidoferrales bacterium]|jgi:molybdopterin-guanine dinucleotide biosynthesis protein A|nr:molybdenum cofactor guanylyltransferase [Candidatus Acidoferrales bacterium]
MPPFPNLEGFVLVGGKSSRMGRDKALLEVAGRPLVARMADLLAPIVSRVTLVGNPQHYAQFGLPVAADSWPGEGPLGGMVTALDAARAPWCVIVACDLPFLTADWLRFLCERATGLGEESDVDAIVPESTRGLEPLCAVYRKACAKPLRAAFERGIRKVTDALAELKLERIAETEWRAFSPDGSLFRNINTPEDYDAIRSRSSPE